MRNDIIMSEQPKPVVAYTQIAERRSDGVYCWHRVPIDAEPSFTQPRDLWPGGESMSREEYEKAHKERQAEHLRNIAKNKAPKWTPCLHDTCPHCLGTGQKIDGSPCVHTIVCDCPRCKSVRMAP